MNRRNAGSALMLAMLFGAVLVLSAFTLIGLSSSYAKGHFAMNQKISATYACEAGLESCRVGAGNSIYDLNGNRFLYEMSVITASGGPGTLTPCMRWTLDAATGTSVDVYVERRVIAATGEPFYRVTARGLSAGMKSEEVMDVKERDTFSKYLFFINNDNINIGKTTLNGLVHCNQTINFTQSGAIANEFVSAVTGITGIANCTFNKGYNAAAAPIALPSFTSITSLGPKTLPAYKFGPGASVQIEFLPPVSGAPSKVKIWNGGTLVTAATGDDLPSNQLIYVDGNITSLKGDIYGRCTVGCTGTVNLTGPIRYVDQDGEPMYKLINKSTGLAVPDEQSTGVGVVWDGVTYDYVKNDTDSPNMGKYNPALPSALGIMATGDIEVVHTSANYNMVFHCALFSATGKRFADLSGNWGNWRFVGSNVTNLGGWRYSGSSGWALSGTYIYDDYLKWNPPPSFMSIDKPVYGPVWRSQ